MAAFITVARAAILQLAYLYDHMEIYGPWDSLGLMAKGHAINGYVTRGVSEMISKGMELMGAYGYVRANNYEKYYRDAAVTKLVLGGVQYSYFVTCRQFYDLDYSAYGPGKLEKPA